MNYLIRASADTFQQIAQRATRSCVCFMRQELPPGATPSFARVGIELDPMTGEAILYVDRAEYKGWNHDVRDWLKRGERRFPNIESLRHWIQTELAGAFLGRPVCRTCGRNNDLSSESCAGCGTDIVLSQVLGEAVLRTRQLIETQTAALITGSISARSIAQELGMPPQTIASAFSVLARPGNGLCLMREGDDELLYRDPCGGRSCEPSLLARIRSWLRGESRRHRQIHRLAQQRARLAQVRNRLAADLNVVRQTEVGLFAQAREGRSSAELHTLAGHVRGLRNHARRLAAHLSLSDQQIEILSTHVHHLVLVDHGASASSPPSDELAQVAANAEDSVQRTRDMAELFASIETSEQEIEKTEITTILKEFEGLKTETVATPLPAQIADSPAAPVPSRPAAPLPE